MCHIMASLVGSAPVVAGPHISFSPGMSLIVTSVPPIAFSLLALFAPGNSGWSSTAALGTFMTLSTSVVSLISGIALSIRECRAGIPGVALPVA